MKDSWTHHHLISIKDLTCDDLFLVIEKAEAIKNGQWKPDLSGLILGSCFFEPSTRTRLSFESAMLRLGGQVIGFSSEQGTSVAKGETVKDTMKMVEGYADLIVLRHGKEGAARLAAQECRVPVINAGDGANQHPTQTLTDLYSITQCFPRWWESGLDIAITGDLKYGRTVHSLVLALSWFPSVRIFFLPQTHFSLPEEYTDLLKRRGIRFSFHASLEEILPRCDLLYMTRLQRERMKSIEPLPPSYMRLDAALIKAYGKPSLRVMHPMPRVDEIATTVDDTDAAYYFPQAHNGVLVRKAILALMIQNGN